MRVIAYCPLHYGKEYLKESIESVIDLCEKIVVLYSPKPSYGFGTNVICPETESELYDIAFSVCGDKLIWVNKVFGNEGEHRSYIYNYTDGYDVLLAFDADEVYKTDELAVAIETVYKGDKQYYGIGGYINFWRSFSFACYDGFTPIRLINLKNELGEGVVPCTIYHFSCAQSKLIMIYKLLIHGHKDEIRPNWLQDIYLKWTPENQVFDKGLHLVAHDLWNTTPFDKNTLPDSLKAHPNFNVDLI